MKIKTGDDYRESLKSLNAEIYVLGEKIKDVTTHPMTRPHVNCAAETYNLVGDPQSSHDPQYEEYLTAESHLTGKKISIFTHIHHSADDLVKKVKMMRAMGRKTGSCFQRCVGHDGINSLYSITFEIDEKLGTDYHQRLKNYLEYVQEENIMIAGAMTDAKGDRGLRPHQQPDPDMFVRVSERRKDGIVVRGCKMHITGAVNSHDVLAMPTVGMGEEEKDFAVAFSIPVDTKGITLVFGRQTNDARRLENGEIDDGNFKYGPVGGEAAIIFEDVFVPWDRVFLCGEHEFSGMFVDRFATAHRQNYGGCKAGVCDVMTGAAALVAEYQGTDKASHIRDKVTEMIHLTETLHCCSLACSYEGKKTPSGAFMADRMLANIVKMNTTRHVYEVARLLHDIAGGYIATLPAEVDFQHPELKDMLEKYYKSKEGVPTEYRVRIGRLIEIMSGGTTLTESMHGAGSPQAQRLMILRRGDIELKKQFARALAGIPEKK
ncbi:MAG: 4-hydroxyphenylacetate 3-hydroxylase family protein [bacterium]